MNEIYGNKQHGIAYEVIHKTSRNAICVRVDYDTHERLDQREHLLERHGKTIRNNYMTFWRKNDTKNTTK